MVVCITFLAYCIMSKNIHSLLEWIKDVDWKKYWMNDFMQNMSILRNSRYRVDPSKQFEFRVGRNFKLKRGV